MASIFTGDDMDWLVFWIALARGVHLAALLSAFGALLFRSVVAADRRALHIARASLVAAIVTAAVWLAIETASIADASGAAEIVQAMPTVLFDTRFGNILIVRLVLLGAALAALGFPGTTARIVALAAAGAAGASQAAIGHAAAAGGVTLPLVETLHILAAGAWPGGLAPLWLVLASDRSAALAALRRFSRLGMICVVTLVATAPIQGWALIGGIGAWFGTLHGVLALGKAALFAVLLALAALNYFRLAPALAKTGTATSLRASVIAETVIGVAVLFTAALMASVAPGVHARPEWPFAWRPSLEAVVYGYQRRELFDGAMTVAAIVALLIVALSWRRLRWAALLGVIALPLVAPLPPLGLLLVPAQPASFYRSPTGFSTTSIAEGARLFAAYCASCHGADGRGNLALSSNPPPDLTGPGVRTSSDGDLFRSLDHGVSPGLSDEARWIDYLRAHGAGIDIAETGEWMFPIAAPAVPGMPRGEPFRIVAGEDTEKGDVATIPIAAGTDSWIAYAAVAGLAPAALGGTQFLVDAHGWLRAVRRPGEPRDGNARQLAEILAHPLAAGETVHRH
jgi:putative copper export protein